MRKYIIERKLQGAGDMTAEELQSLSKTSNAVISILGRPYRWIESYVTDDRIYCIHEAEDEADIREHAKCGSFPADRIEEIRAVISPATAEGMAGSSENR
jgi:hypothetical protein